MKQSTKNSEPRAYADEQVSTNAAVQEAQERAERAEDEVKSMKHTIETLQAQQATGKRPSSASEGDLFAQDTPEVDQRAPVAEEHLQDPITELRKDSMMAHLMDSLNAGKDIGHYGRLVFAMVAHHFLSDEEVIEWLTKDADFGNEAATAMLRQVEGRDYNPPRRERIVAWQSEQDFPILPQLDDPDSGNVYRNLKFPQQVYEHIQDYQEEKAAAAR